MEYLRGTTFELSRMIGFDYVRATGVVVIEGGCRSPAANLCNGPQQIQVCFFRGRTLNSQDTGRNGSDGWQPPLGLLPMSVQGAAFVRTGTRFRFQGEMGHPF